MKSAKEIQPGDKVQLAVHEANAQLIAAAPELLSALIGAEQIISVCDGDWEKPLQQIRAVIAKASSSRKR